MIGLKNLRYRESMTQENLAQKLGVTQSMIAKWENGGSYPRGEMLTRLADVLHCTIDELFGRNQSDSA